jgi:hypothetical protein
MKKYLFVLALLPLFIFFSFHKRHIRHSFCQDSCFRKVPLNYRYGANDIFIQTSRLAKTLMDRWFVETKYIPRSTLKPIIQFGTIENKTDSYISLEMIHDIFESVATLDKRFVVVASHSKDENELDLLLKKQIQSEKYSDVTRCIPNQVTAPRFLAKLRITKAKSAGSNFDIEDYRMTMTLYDIETQEIIDQAFDLLRKYTKRT